MFRPPEMSNSGSSASQSVHTQEEASQENKPESSSNSLLSLLDDKNRAIAALQKQLQNQKEQLSYYLKRELRAPRIIQLSESCSPRAPEESMTVNLAMNKFGKQAGIKSNICNLYERMCSIDDRITGSLQDQEFILRKIVNKLCEFVKYANDKIEFKVQFSNFITDPFHIELFNKLLNATVNLRKKLDTFRICCNRLMVVEDERNSIVEQIYAMPTDQRMNSNYIISIQMEKVQLENEIKQILQEQGEDKERIKELNIIEEKLSNLQSQLNSAFMRTDETCRINKMLQKVNSEAKILLELTKEQRRKYEKELQRARCQKNLSLERMLLYIKLAMENKDPDKDEMAENGINTKEDLTVFECIKKEIDNGRDRIIGKIFDELQIKRKECDTVKNKLNQIMLEKNELKIANVQLQRDISEIKFNQSRELSRLIQERDTYKSQVADLEAIREAYAQLVDRQPTTCRVEREYLEQITERDKQIEELEKRNMNLTQKMNVMKMIIGKQHKEIKLQSEIIEDLKAEAETTKEFEDRTKQMKHVCNKPSTDDSGIYSSPRETPVTEDYTDSVSYNELYEEEIFVEQQINWVEEKRYQSPLRTKQVSFSPEHIDNNSDYKKQTKKLVENIKNHIIEKVNESENKKSITPFKMSKMQEKVGIKGTVINTSGDVGLQENIEIEQTSSFCLKFNCKPKANEVTNDGKNDQNIDEYELMRDCSQETIPVICVPRKKYNKNSLEKQCTRKHGKPKKVEILANFDGKINSESSEEYMNQNKFKNNRSYRATK